MSDLPIFVLTLVPIMVLLGIRHALDVDHIAAIDKKSRPKHVLGGRPIGIRSLMAKFKCDICGAEYGSDEKLADHYMTHVSVPVSMPG